MSKKAPKCSMRMLDADRHQPVRVLQLYLNVNEARELHRGLASLLEDPEKNDHIHVFASDAGAELSFSVLTEAKLNRGGYTELEYRVFREG